MALGRFQRSAALLSQAYGVLKEDPALAVFPIISSVATLAALASFAVPIASSPELRSAFEQLAESNRHGNHAAEGEPASAQAKYTVIALMFCFYLVTQFLTVFFNSALLGAADRRFRGLPGGVGDGIGVAMSRLPQILGWTLLSAIVGTILRATEERVGIIGKIVVGLIGMAWAIASYFAVPALVIEGVGPFEAVRRSAAAIQRTWGESLVLGIGFGVAGFLVTLACVLTMVAGVAAGVATQSVALGCAIGGLGLAALLLWFVVASTLRSIVQVALYRYALDGTVPPGFEAGAIRAAFQPK